ncbi:hypothetical protein JL722_2841 [Aureococcus anophagefferens]|nr:hypothetical protein JL722_2841 [Aureococcus anophagefferens]
MRNVLRRGGAAALAASVAAAAAYWLRRRRRRRGLRSDAAPRPPEGETWLVFEINARRSQPILIRRGADFDSEVVAELAPGSRVVVAELRALRGRQRCRVVRPVEGWASVTTSRGRPILVARPDVDFLDVSPLAPEPGSPSSSSSSDDDGRYGRYEDGFVEASAGHWYDRAAPAAADDADDAGDAEAVDEDAGLFVVPAFEPPPSWPAKAAGSRAGPRGAADALAAHLARLCLRAASAAVTRGTSRASSSRTAPRSSTASAGRPRSCGSPRSEAARRRPCGARAAWAPDLEASFAAGAELAVATADPDTGGDFENDDVGGAAILVRRGGGISFEDKAARASEAGAGLCIIANDEDGDGLIRMARGDGSRPVGCPVVFVSKAGGDALRGARVRLDAVAVLEQKRALLAVGAAARALGWKEDLLPAGAWPGLKNADAPTDDTARDALALRVVALDLGDALRDAAVDAAAARFGRGPALPSFFGPRADLVLDVDHVRGPSAPRAPAAAEDSLVVGGVALRDLEALAEARGWRAATASPRGSCGGRRSSASRPRSGPSTAPRPAGPWSSSATRRTSSSPRPTRSRAPARPRSSSRGEPGPRGPGAGRLGRGAPRGGSRRPRRAPREPRRLGEQALRRRRPRRRRLRPGGLAALLRVCGTRPAIAASLTALSLWGNELRAAGGAALGTLVAASASLTWLDARDCALGDAGVAPLAAALGATTSLTWLNLRENGLGDAGGFALRDALLRNATLTRVDLVHNPAMTAASVRGLSAPELRNVATLVHDLVPPSPLRAARRRRARAGAAAPEPADDGSDGDAGSGDDGGASGGAPADGGLVVRSGGARVLDLSHRGLSARDAALVVGVLKDVDEIDASGNDLGDAGVVALCEAFKDAAHERLARLSLEGTNFGSRGACALGAALARWLPSLETLALPGDLPVGLKGARTLGDGLAARARPLATLDLRFAKGPATSLPAAALRDGDDGFVDVSDRRLGPAAAVVVAILLGKNASVTAVDASGNGSSRRPTTLTDLNLGGNPAVGPDGVAAIARAARVQARTPSPHKLTRLDLSHVDVGSGASAIADALLADLHLTELNLRFSKLDSAGAEDIAECLGMATKLTKLDVSANGLSPAARRALADAADANPKLRVRF